MFNTPNDCFVPSSTSPSGLIFNRQHHASRYHPYNRVSSTYYPSNELETYSYDNNNANSNPNHHTSTVENYDHSMMPYDYNLAWTTSSSSLEHDMSMEGATTMGSNLGGTGRMKFPCLFPLFPSTENFFMHSKGLLVVSNDVYQLTKKNDVGRNRLTRPSPIFVRRFPTFNPIRNYPRSKPWN